MKLILSIVILLSAPLLFAQKYSKVKIYTNSQGLQQLAELGLPVDHGNYKQGHFFISDFSEMDIQKLNANGFQYDILIDDVKAYYIKNSGTAMQHEKNANCPPETGGFNPPTPANYFENSSYMGFMKYQDMLDALDSMAAQYPNLITVKSPISSFLTNEGRPIFHVKISDDPTTDDATEPNVLYTAIHHAREPLSMSQTIFYMWYLLENYATNEEVQFLVDNTEMYFVPCINPDGYIHNEVNDPNGGGMHRKNKRNVGTTNPGVDLNRNYSYQWNTTGTSANTNDDTYPGTGPFSEPETQAIQWLVETYGFVSALNAHTYGDQLLFPIGTTVAEFADHHDYFQDLSNHMVKDNGYSAIKSSGLYPASGDSDDYMYKVDIGVGNKDTVFAMTPEIGPEFWPAQSEILPTCKEMVFPNLILSHMTHKYLAVKDEDPSLIGTMNGNFNHSAQRLGFENGPITVSIEPLQNIQSVGTPVVYNLNLRETATGAISYNLTAGIQYGDPIVYVLNTEYGTWTKRDTITKTYGAITLQFSDDATTSTNWTGSWSLTTDDSYSPPTSFTESDGGDYSNNANEIYELIQSIDLTYATEAMISFYAKWEIEADYDYCQFQVSTNGGATWIGQCGNYTVEGTNSWWGGGAQPDGEPVWEGSSDWVYEEISLSDYLGQIINVRFQFESDGGLTMDGFYFDDFKVSYNDEAGLNELGQMGVKVFPNPANQQAIISLSQVIDEGQVKIYDQAGKLVYTKDIEEQTNHVTVDTSKLPYGIYMIHVNSGNSFIQPVKLAVVH